MHQLDHSARELAGARPRLVDELVVIPQMYGDRRLFHLELPSRSRFYRVGEAEYTFLTLLDGNTTIAGAVSQTARLPGVSDFTQQQGLTICRWLAERGMIELDDPTGRGLSDLDPHGQIRRFAAGLNPLWIRRSLGNPDQLLQRLHRAIGWVHSPLAIGVWVVVCLAAISTFAQHQASFATAPRALLSQSNWVWLAGSWLILKLIHEISHGLAARRYGGRVPEAGIALVLLIPMAYVDVSAAYRFRSRWHRIHTALAGMYAELFIAAIAVLLWPHVESPEVQSRLYNVIFAAACSTVLFNANPLMRFDGYFVLSDLLGIPNLYVEGQQYVRGLRNRLLLGEPRPSLEWSGWKAVVIRVYGIMAALWRVVVTASLLIAASVMFDGAGIVLAVGAVAAWLLVPLVRLIRGDLTGNTAFGRRTRGVATVGVLAGLATAIALFAPWPGHRTAPAIVQCEPLTVLRAESEGFVDEVLVRNGDLVTKGQLLVRLTNRELQVRLRELELELARSQAAQRMYRQQDAIASAQIEQRNYVEKQRQLQEARKQSEALEIRAPHDGRILARGLTARLGTWASQGDTVLQVGSDLTREIQISVAQSDVDAYRDAVGERVHVRLSGVQRFDARLLSVEPRATRHPRHAAFLSPNGGPLTVVAAEDVDSADPNPDQAEYEYLRPRFVARVGLEHASQRYLRPGQTGSVALPQTDLSLGRGVYLLVADWVRDQARDSGYGS